MANEAEQKPVTIASLGDLTDRQEHAGRPLPQIWVDWLRQAFPDAEITTEPPPPPGSALHALIPGTRVVVRTKPFVWQLVKSGVGLWVMLATARSAPAASLVGTAAGVLDALRTMREALLKLDENAGETCTYAAVVHAGEPVLRKLGVFPEGDDIWEAHQVVRQDCPVTACLHHKDGCKAERADVDLVVERLLQRGVLEKRGPGLWPAT